MVGYEKCGPSGAAAGKIQPQPQKMAPYNSRNFRAGYFGDAGGVDASGGGHGGNMLLR